MCSHDLSPIGIICAGIICLELMGKFIYDVLRHIITNTFHIHNSATFVQVTGLFILLSRDVTIQFIAIVKCLVK